MRRVALAALAAVLAVPAPAAAAAPGQELEQAEQQLDATVQRLGEARDAYEAAEQRLGELRVELGEVRSRLQAARSAEDQAQHRERRAQRRAERAAKRRDRRQRRLSLRIVDTYQHGVSEAGNLWLASLTGARTPHDLARAEWATRHLIERDAELADAAEAAEQQTRRARREAAAAAQQAHQRRAEIQELAAEQEGLLEEAEAERAEQQAIVDELAADQQAQAELVAELERQLGSVEAVLTEPRQVPFDQPAPAWASGLPAPGRSWAGEIDAAATRAGVEGRFFAALVWTESYFQPGAVSPAGAVGLAQLLPSTAEAMGVDPHDPIDNLVGGARYLRRQLETFRDFELALAAYNAGPGRVSEAGGVPDIVETRLYVLTVVERWRGLLD